MDDFIPRGNIERFAQKLKVCGDNAERKVLTELLAVERLRLKEARGTQG